MTDRQTFSHNWHYLFLQKTILKSGMTVLHALIFSNFVDQKKFHIFEKQQSTMRGEYIYKVQREEKEVLFQ
jgi:hypothetical protein